MVLVIPGRPLAGHRHKRQLFSDVADRLQCTAGLIPLKFISYSEDVTLVFDCRHHLFANDMQAYADALLSGVSNMCGPLHNCSDFPTFTPAKAGTRFGDFGEMQVKLT